MRVLLINDTVVRFARGEKIEVSEEEGKRLIAFNNAVEIKKAEAKPAKKKKK